jgi:hypothetical protein
MSMLGSVSRRAARAGLGGRVGVVRALSAPPKAPPPAPSPAEVERQIKVAEAKCKEIREGTFRTGACQRVLHNTQYNSVPTCSMIQGTPCCTVALRSCIHVRIVE